MPKSQKLSPWAIYDENNQANHRNCPKDLKDCTNEITFIYWFKNRIGIKKIHVSLRYQSDSFAHKQPLVLENFPPNGPGGKFPLWYHHRHRSLNRPCFYHWYGFKYKNKHRLRHAASVRSKKDCQILLSFNELSNFLWYYSVKKLKLTKKRFRDKNKRDGDNNGTEVLLVSEMRDVPKS